ncbi:MAG: FtsX-like permease family protein, partial [Eubacteriales bacterium]|nr:FtsX-like permease family protein [Eubacteriales bacterium]
LILSIISVVLIIYTIKLTVYVRKNEINIMKYVGATDWFIRWPFVVEGVIIGLIGSLISIIICVSFYGKVNELIYTNIPIVENYIEFRSTFEMFLIIGPSTLLLGSLIGIIGSVSSIKKYLNV